MAFQFLRFAKNYNIQIFDESDSDKHTRKGWIQTKCPVCKTNKLHLGWNKTGHYFHCWSGGHHSRNEIVSSFLNCSKRKAQRCILTFSDDRPVKKYQKEDSSYSELFDIELPTGTRKLNPRHIKYLKKRGFNYTEILKSWDVRGTGPVGDLSHRLVFPVYLNGFMVHYQTRDITEKADIPYKQASDSVCPVKLKHTLYGIDKIPSKTCIIVEGIFDVLRIGHGAVATFGSSWKEQQLHLLSSVGLKTAYVLFDEDNIQVRKQADGLLYSLESLGINTMRILIEADDPAEMDETETKEVKNLILNGE